MCYLTIIMPRAALLSFGTFVLLVLFVSFWSCTIAYYLVPIHIILSCLMDQSNVQGSGSSSAPPPGPTFESGSRLNDSETNQFRHVPIRVAVFSAVLLPLVLAPYLFTRGRTLILKRRVDELHHTKHALRLEIDAAIAKLSAVKAEAQGIRATLHSVMVDADAARHQMAGLKAGSEASRRDLDRLLTESLHSRAQTAALRALGSSLADVAAFMHEMELQMGIEPLSRDAQRRVDRLRIAALRLQNLTGPQQPATSHDGNSPGTKPAGGQKTA